jgi:hypothetical protein
MAESEARLAWSIAEDEAYIRYRENAVNAETGEVEPGMRHTEASRLARHDTKELRAAHEATRVELLAALYARGLAWRSPE